MPVLRAILFAVFFFPCLCAFSSPVIEKTILPNGLTVLVQPMPASEVVSLYAFVKTGSATEGEFSGTGISHFAEHMLFKGTARRGVGVIAQEVRALGGTINASTTLDYTLYTLNLPKEQFTKGLDIMADMLMNSAFDPAQVEKERQVIHGEMRLYNDQPGRRLNEAVFRNAYVRHTYRHPIIGYPQLFDQISRDQLYEYYRARYVPNNIVFSVAGGIDPKENLVLITEAFKQFKPLPFPEPVVPPEPPQISPRYLEEYYPTSLFRFSFGYAGVSINNPDLYALDILAMALGQGESSRFYKEIYKKRRLVESISSSHFTPADRGLFEIEGSMTKDNLAAVRQAVDDIIADVGRRGLLPAELEKTRRQVLSGFIFSNQTSSSRALRAAADEAMTGDAQFSQHYVEAVKNVTNKDIKRVARQYLTSSSLSLTILRPQSTQESRQKDTEKVLSSPVQKLVLTNGLTVLLKEDHTVGVVSLNVFANAGLRQETVPLNGISHLLSQVWTKGTQAKTAEQIAQAMEGRGGFLSGFTGRNAIGLQMQVLSQDLPFALELLTELIAQPTFPTDAITREKAQMEAAIDDRDEDVQENTLKQLLEMLYLEHPYRFDALGNKESVKAITRGDLLDYYHRFVQPGNMVIAIFGDFDSARLKGKVEEQFGHLKNIPVPLQSFTEPPPQKTRLRQLEADKEQTVVMFGFQAPAFKDKDRWPMTVINTVLGSGLSGRLFVKVRDELGKAYTVGSQYVPGIDSGMFVLFVLTTADKVDSVRGIIERELNLMQTVALSQLELASAKAYIKGTFKMGLNTPASLASMCGLNELYGLGYDFPEKFNPFIDAVTAEQVQQAARKYLGFNSAAIMITKGRPPSHE